MSEPVERKPIDRWLPGLFFVFFAVVLSVNGIMVYFAASSWTGLETKQSYIKGRDYNRTLDAVAQQKARGWDAGLSIKAGDRDHVRLDLTLFDARKHAVAGADVSARLVRPTHEGYDLEIHMDDYGAGRYMGELRAPLAGQWDVRVVARHPSGDYRVTRRVVIP
jgi:nitrogen fixation protein FixH